MEETSIGVFSILVMICPMGKAPMPKMDHEGIGSRLDALRTATGLEKGVFAESCGIDPSSYSKIIKGEKALKVEMGYAVSVRWGVSMDYLYRGTLEKLPPSFASSIITNLTGRDA
ncbi:helix-turn-helix domain-containing protein [Paracoccus sulfuroxidans]|uniref:helix-turn-helix domain-containing protein n=1 Tax=Paracoccus sulfuroxidans TaxID=384678 RepID=UPI00119DDE32